MAGLTSRPVRRIVLLAFVSCLALSACAEPAGGGIDIIDVSGPLDASALDFISASIERGADVGQELAVIQLNSRAVLDADAYDLLVRVLESPPLPVAIWVGPAPAQAFGGAARLPEVVEHAAIAPLSSIGHLDPEVLGDDPRRSDAVVAASETGLDLQPSVRQYLQALDGATFLTSDGPVVVSTVEEFEGGVTVKTPTFRKPGLATRFFRLKSVSQ